MRRLAMVLLAGIALSGAGCATSDMLNDARRANTYSWTQYESAFLTEDALVLNGRIAFSPHKRPSPISALYPIDAASGLPGNTSRDTHLKTRRAPAGSRPVPIVVIYAPCEPGEVGNDPRAYHRVALTNLPPTLLVNAKAPLSELTTPAPDVNLEHTLYVDGAPPRPRGSVVLHTPQYTREETDYSMLVWLPFTVAFDAVTLPLQGLCLGVVVWALHDMQKIQ